MAFAPAERADLCDALLAVGPSATTLCEGWTASDLVAHVWTRENDLVAAPGIAVPALAGVTEARSRRALERWGFTGLVELVRQGPPRGSVFALPGADEQANTIEMFIHTEDVRRPNGLPRRPRSDEFEEMAWRRLAAISRHVFRTTPFGVVLERQPGTDQVRAKAGARTVTVVGPPSELLLFAFGRTSDADVRLIGTPGDVATLRGERSDA